MEQTMRACWRHTTPFGGHSSPPRSARQLRTVSVTCRASDRHPQVVQQAQDVLKRCLVGVAAAAVLAGAPMLAPGPLAPLSAQAGMISREPVKNAGALLRFALPVDNKAIRKVQTGLEEISEILRIPGSKSLGKVSSAVHAAASTLDRDGSIVAALAPEKKAEGLEAIAKLKQKLNELQDAVATQQKARVFDVQQEALGYVGTIEEAMVRGFPFEVPSQYANLPQLKGRATVEMKIKFATPRDNNNTSGVLRIVADGYNAPLSAGDFVDLVSRGFYNGMEIQRADGFVVQTGRPADGEGFVENGQVRRIPFEVMVQGDKEPVYEETLQDNGRFNETPVLPFNAFGTLALARSELETNDASSQIFFLLKESELTPTGSNLLDGRYAVLGYVTENAPILAEIQVGDKIEYAKVTEGLENLQRPKAS